MLQGAWAKLKPLRGTCTGYQVLGTGYRELKLKLRPGDLPHNICLVFHTLWEDVGAISDYAL